jgi:hypothetical protein
VVHLLCRIKSFVRVRFMHFLRTIPPFMFALIGWVGGVATTIAGSWIASKIHVYHAHRDAHRDEIRTLVLEPLLACLRDKLLPLVRIANPLLEGGSTQTFYNENASSTEPDYAEGEALVIEVPWKKFRDTVDPVLYEDAKTRHFKDLIRRIEDFARAWEKYTDEVTDWVGEMSRRIAVTSVLPSLSHGRGVKFYAASRHIAVFIYKRIFQIPVRPLFRGPDAGGEAILTDENGVSVAYALPKQITDLVALTNTIIADQKHRGPAFLSKARDMSSQLDGIIPAVQLAIADKKLKKRCGLVRFF